MDHNPGDVYHRLNPDESRRFYWSGDSYLIDNQSLIPGLSDNRIRGLKYPMLAELPACSFLFVVDS